MSKDAAYAEVGNYRLATWVRGTGNLIVVISGGPGLASDYLIPSFLELQSSRRIAVFDQPGCGSSNGERPSAEDTVQATNAIVAALVRDEPFTLVAHSWGAYLAARYCAASHRLPKATVLLNPVSLSRSGYDAVGARLGARVKPEVMQEIGRLSAEGSRSSGRELMRLAKPAYFGREDNLPILDLDYSIETFNSVAASLGDFDFWPTLNAMGALTLVFGEHDYIVPEDYRAHVPKDARVQVVSSGHFSMIDAARDVLSTIEAASA